MTEMEYRLEIERERKREKAEEIANTLTDMVNSCSGGSYEMECLINGILRQHRTLQQSFFSQFVLKLIETVANMRRSCCTDGRNIEMKKTCDLLFKALQENDRAYVDMDGNKKVYELPFI